MSIFEKNVAEIRKYNPKLADKILTHKFSKNAGFEIVNCESGDPNLVYNGTLIHSSKDPQQEARENFEKLQDSSESSISVIIGLGLGYLFKRFYLSSKGKIVVFEPNLDILRFTLEIVDFTQELASKRVLIAGTPVELVKFLDENYLYKGYLNISALSSSQSLYPEEIKKLQENLPQITSQLQGNFNTLFNKAYPWLTQGILNIPVLVKSYGIDSLRDKFKSKPAIIVSSGPSLDKSIHHLAKHRDKVIVFCASNAYKTLVKHNIKPDFIVFIDVDDVTAQVQGFDLSDINLISQPISCASIFKLNTKRKFAFYDNNDLFSRWISEICGFSVKEYRNKGTVSYCALYSAFMMGCSPIIMEGQDLAYADGRCYSPSSAFGSIIFKKDEFTGKYKAELEDSKEFTKYCIGDKPIDPNLTAEKCIQRKLDEITANISFVRGQNGEMLPTDANYVGFIKFFEQFAYEKSDSEVELINSSTGGAQIDGFKNIDLAQVLENLNDSATNTEEVISETLKNYKEPVREHIDNLENNIKYMLEDIEEFIPIAKDGLDKASKLFIELNKSKLNLERIRSLSGYLMEYFVKFQEELFDSHLILTNCVFKELMELNLILGHDSVAIDGKQDLINIAKASKAFYWTFLDRIAIVKSYLEFAQRETFSESAQI